MGLARGLGENPQAPVVGTAVWGWSGFEDEVPTSSFVVSMLNDYLV